MAKKREKTGYELRIEGCIDECVGLEADLGSIVIPTPNLRAVEHICRARREVLVAKGILQEALKALNEG